MNENTIKMLPSILVSNKRAYAQVKREALVSLKLTHSNIAAVRVRRQGTDAGRAGRISRFRI